MHIEVKDGKFAVILGMRGSLKDAEHIARLKDLPGYRPSQGRKGDAAVHILPQTYPVALALSSPGWPMPSVSHEASAAIDRLCKAQDLKEKWLSEPMWSYVSEVLKRDLMPHQGRAVQAIKNLGYRALLADDMGLGKTTVAIASHRVSGAKRCLVICPASVKYNWQNELREVVGATPFEQTFIIDGSKAKRETTFGMVVRQRPEFVIINYDLLMRLEPEQMSVLEEHVDGGTVILDESHYIKDPKAKRSKLAAELARCATNVLLLTGTPVRNMITDLFHQLQVLAPVWKSQWEFEDKYLVKREIKVGGRKVFKPVGTRNEEQLNAVVNCYQIRRMKEDVLDLPEKMPPVIAGIDLDPKHLSIYKAMKKDWLYAFDMVPGDTPILSKKAENAMIALLRCEQLAQGFVGGLHRELAAKLGKRLDDAERIDGREEELFFPKHPKVRWLVETLESLLLNEKSPCVWFKYNAPLHWFATRLPELIPGAKPIVLHGGLSSEQKAQAVSDFQAGVGNIFLGQVKMAEGFNLTRSQDAIFYGRDWSPAINSQAEDRIHRIGQTGTCNIYLPVTNDTIEAHIHARLREKRDTAESVMASLTVAELKEML
jgi:hypothetical protein